MAFIGAFKLTCVGTQRVLDVPYGNAEAGSNIVTYALYHGNLNQKWIGKVDGNRCFISTALSLKKTGSALVIQESPTKHQEVVLWPFQGDKNQLWEAVQVQDQFGICLIRNVESGRCLKGSGRVQNFQRIKTKDNRSYVICKNTNNSIESVQCVKEDHNDKCQWWRCEIVESI